LSSCDFSILAQVSRRVMKPVTKKLVRTMSRLYFMVELFSRAPNVSPVNVWSYIGLVLFSVEPVFPI